jgi:hypothetical protein
MVKRLLTKGFWLRSILGLAIVGFASGVLLPTAAGGMGAKHHKTAPDADAQKHKVMASQPPAFSIPVEPLGFFAPGAFYQGQRESLVSLDFLDENRLLFTFRAPGLIHRTADSGADERQIRAEVLTLPQGTMETEALWTLHDHDRYLWMLHDGHFLLRDGDTLKEGSATLDLKPLLQFLGPLQWLETDPSEQFLVTDSQEPAVVTPKPNFVGSPSTAQANVTEDNPPVKGQPDTVLRILRRSTGQVMLVSRVRTIVHLPINSEGYLETLRGSGRDWVLNLNYFTGGSRVLGKVESFCEPPVEFLSRDTALVNTCAAQGGRDLVALSTEGHRLWDAPLASTQVWPLLVRSPNNSRFARETLTVSHPVDSYSPLSFDEVSGQLVEVFDSARGTLDLKAPASPVLDAGGNLAISPSGRRVAVLNDGAIQVYELPAPQSTQPQSSHRAP